MSTTTKGKKIKQETEIIFCGHPIHDFEKCPILKTKNCMDCVFVIDEN